eukprot:SAG31_NODE_3473_length_4234_cov_1.624667_2_plen_208_part_00
MTVHFFMLDTVKWVGLCNSDAKKFDRPRVDTKHVGRSWLAAMAGGAGRYQRAMMACHGDPCCVYSNWTKYLDARCEVLQPDPNPDAPDFGWQLRISCDLENRLSRYGTAQRRWLENRLNGSHAHWKVVVGHHPVWSVSDHGECCMITHDNILSWAPRLPLPLPCRFFDSPESATTWWLRSTVSEVVLMHWPALQAPPHGSSKSCGHS